MKKSTVWKKAISCTLMASMVLSMTACGGKKSGGSKEATDDSSQTDFTIMGGMGALSKGYDDNEVLNAMQKEAGINID